MFERARLQLLDERRRGIASDVEREEAVRRDRGAQGGGR
jgi:hypothetical protein